MNQNDTRRSGRRRRGGRRRSNDREETAELKSAPKQNLWQKILAFFRPKTKPQRKTATAQTKPARQYPVYEPRQKSSTEAFEPRPARKPEAVEVTTPKLYVGNLSFETSESDLFELFKGVGQVQNAEIVTHKDSEKSKGFGFVTMTNVDEAKRAVLELHDRDFMGRKLVVSGAKTPPGR
jgi:RNA recognition motif-containing protein